MHGKGLNPIGPLLCAAIKDAVINAVEELYISNRPPQEAAQCLIDLTHGSNLGTPLTHFTDMHARSIGTSHYMDISADVETGVSIHLQRLGVVAVTRFISFHAGELSALEEVVAHLIRHQPQPLLKPITLRALWWLCERAHRAALSPASTEVTRSAFTTFPHTPFLLCCLRQAEERSIISWTQDKKGIHIKKLVLIASRHLEMLQRRPAGNMRKRSAGQCC